MHREVTQAVPGWPWQMYIKLHRRNCGTDWLKHATRWLGHSWVTLPLLLPVSCSSLRCWASRWPLTGTPCSSPQWVKRMLVGICSGSLSCPLYSGICSSLQTGPGTRSALDHSSSPHSTVGWTWQTEKEPGAWQIHTWYELCPDTEWEGAGGINPTPYTSSAFTDRPVSLGKWLQWSLRDGWSMWNPPGYSHGERTNREQDLYLTAKLGGWIGNGSNMVLDYWNSELSTPGGHAPFPVRSHGRLMRVYCFKGGASWWLDNWWDRLLGWACSGRAMRQWGALYCYTLHSSGWAHLPYPWPVIAVMGLPSTPSALEIS